MQQSLLKLNLIIAVSLTLGIRSNSQPVTIPDEYRKSSITEQLNQTEAHTRIYENYRAVREDIFQILSRNIKDTVAGAKRKINNLNSVIAALNVRIDSINKAIETAKSSVDEMTRTKNSISVLGLEVNKTTYNSITWTIIVILIFLLVIGYMIFRTNLSTTIRSKKELVEVKNEFEEYRKRKNIEHEKMIMSHFNEIKKIKEEKTKR
jgi:hypothetical protein